MIIAISFLLVLFLYALISAYPTAQTTYRRIYLREDEEKSDSVPQIILHWLESPMHEQHFPVFIRSIKILFLTALGALLMNWIISRPIQNWLQESLFPAFPLSSSWVYALFLILILFVFLFFILFFGEFLPEKIALFNPQTYLVFGFPFISVLYALFSWIFHGIENTTNLLFNQQQKELIKSRGILLASFEIREIVNDPQTASDLPALEREILESVISFNDMLVAQVTIPRTEVIAVESQTPILQALEICLDKGVTKLPVFIDQLDNIEGIVHLRDLVRKIQQEPECNQPAISLIRETLFVPEAVPLQTLLHQFRSQHMHMAIVLDEFGGTAGVVTLEDLLEEVFGDIMDPFETLSPAIQAQKDGSFLVDGHTTIDDFNDYFNFNLQVPAYQTIAGYVLAQLNCIPQTGDHFEDTENKLSVAVKSMDRLRVEKVLVQFYLSPALRKAINISSKTITS
ncbi:MAG: HlyC/CorC family transporter [Anaerolineaceae bacterium]|nr:HlyC/CorC family transporter [Anaerolineaceae bacterium]